MFCNVPVVEEVMTFILPFISLMLGKVTSILRLVQVAKWVGMSGISSPAGSNTNFKPAVGH